MQKHSMESRHKKVCSWPTAFVGWMNTVSSLLGNRIKLDGRDFLLNHVITLAFCQERSENFCGLIRWWTVKPNPIISQLTISLFIASSFSSFVWFSSTKYSQLLSRWKSKYVNQRVLFWSSLQNNWVRVEFRQIFDADYKYGNNFSLWRYRWRVNQRIFCASLNFCSISKTDKR